jgi:exodeoxyribonuclease VII small subunit
MKDDTTPVRYRDATEELKAILARLEGDDVDIDELSEKVERAAELIRLCRDRIEHTGMKVRRVLDDLDAPATKG